MLKTHTLEGSAVFLDDEAVAGPYCSNAEGLFVA
jgi:hypothetical protein